MAKGTGAIKRNKLWLGKPKRVARLVIALALLGALAVSSAALLERRIALAGGEEAAPGLRIEELMSENTHTLVTESGEVPDWIELYNAGSEPVALNRWMLLLESSLGDAYRLPDRMLAPGEYLLIYAVGSGATEECDAPFRLPASGGDALALLDPRGRLADTVALPELRADCSYQRRADGDWEVSERPTPGGGAEMLERIASQAANPTPGELELTEAMSGNVAYCPDGGACYDYVEIHNRGGAAVELEGWYLSDSVDKLKRWSFPAATLPADGYLVVYCSGRDIADGARPHTDFKLSGEGEGIYLSRPDGETVSSVTLPALAKGQAWSLVDGEWSAALAPTPGRENSREAAARTQAETFASAASGLQISEIMTAPSAEPSDWIELYNASSTAVDLSGCGLSDDIARPRRWRFPAGTSIAPGQYLGVLLTGGAVPEGAEGYVCADFKLGAEGGYTVCLSDPEGKLLDAVYLEEQYGGISVARFPGEDGFFYAETATPLAANAGAHYRSRCPMAEPSVPGGLFEKGERISVELRAPEGSRVYYTLDCTDPDEGDALYTGPIEISSTTILRSRVYRDGAMPSYIAAQSYLYGVEVPEGVYVVSLVSDPDNLYSDERGILVKGPHAWSEFPYGSTNKGANFWMDWERPANVELFTSDGALAFAQPCGIKLHGQFSRASSVKAFKVFARSEYGKNRFDYPIFKNRDYDSYQSFLLRASGQDYNMTFMRDSVLTQLAADTSLMYQESELGVCYLNGEYYSLFNLRERVSRFSICQFEGWEGMEDDIDLIKANDVEKEGSNQSMAELLDWIKHNDMTTQAAYDYIAERIDVQNYIEYMVMEIYSGNGDTLNVKRYRNAKTDGKWRWVLFDLDWAFLTDTNSMRRWINPDGMGTGSRTDNSLFIACLKNPIFRDQFLTYFGQRMATTFTAENMLRAFDERYQKLLPLLPDYLPKVGMDREEYLKQYEILTDYARERPRKMMGYLRTVFDLSKEEWQHYFGDAIAIIQGE